MTDDSTDGEFGHGDAAEHLTYDIEDGTRPSTAVVQAVAALTDTDVLDQEPLYDAIDPNHLDSVFADHDDGVRSGSVSFEFNGCQVTVDPTTVHVRTGSE